MREAETGLLRVFFQQLPRLRRIAAGIGMVGADIDDVLQSVSVQALERSDCPECEETMTRWLVTTTVNQCLTEHRRRFRHRTTKIVKHRLDLEEALTLGVADTTSQVAMAEEREIIRQAMAELDPSLLKIIVLRYFCDVDSSEIGRTLSLSASTVRSRLREARMILARKLLRQGVKTW